MKRTRKAYEVTVRYPSGKVENVLIEALDVQDAVRKVRRNAQGANSVTARPL